MSGDEARHITPLAPPQTVGVIGLGNMGFGLALNIRKTGYRLAVMAHRRRDAVETLVAEGAIEYRTPAAMARDCKAIVLCVATSEQVEGLVEGEAGIAAGAAKGLIVVDCTTSAPSPIMALQQAYPTLAFVDAPLGRSPKEALEGRLSTLVGADEGTYQAILPVLGSFADTVRRVGPLGSGHKLKLVNNFVSMGYAAIYAQALALALKTGLASSDFVDLIESSRMNCAFFQTFIQWTLTGDASSHPFSLSNGEHTLKDVADLCRANAVDSALADSITAIFSRAVADGLGAANLPELPRSTTLAAGLDLDGFGGLAGAVLLENGAA